MRLRKLRRGSWAAWLGAIALGVNALVPIHFAFDFAEAFEATHEEAAPIGGRDLEWRLVAVLSGHFDAGGEADRHGAQHRPVCAVCTSFGTLGGFAPAVGTVLSAPVPVIAAVALAAAASAPDSAPAAAYRSRAPPLA